MRIPIVNHETCIERIFESLVTGDRSGVDALLTEMDVAGIPHEARTQEIYWPVLETISGMYRSDHLSMLAHHFATRMLRRLVFEAGCRYGRRPLRNRSVLLFCGATEVDDIAGQMVCDFMTADGYEVRFGGGGIANDEILEAVGVYRPDVLLMFASTAGDAPNIRQMIDTVREIDSCPNMQIVVGGGVFNRAEGLAEEIGADLWVRDPRDLLVQLERAPERRAASTQRTVGRTRRTVPAERAAA
jgi:methanogenic corrinoid protein MtbC1